MKLRNLTYFLHEAFVSLFRNRLMALASIITVVSCIFILSFSYCIAINIDYLLEQLESSLNLAVYIDDDLSPEKVPELSKRIEAIPNVKSVHFISAEDALKNFAASIDESDKDLLAGFEDDNPMPRSFDVALTDVSHEQSVMDELNKLKSEGIGQIQYNQKIIDIITTFNTGVRIVSVIIVLCLIAISVVIIMNTIKITVNSRRTEIVIMKYIGATDWFVRWPFIIEGVLIGLFGAIIPVAICWAFYNRATATIYEKMAFLENLVEFKSSYSIFLVLLPLSVLMGVAIGAIASITSLKKYLKA